MSSMKYLIAMVLILTSCSTENINSQILEAKYTCGHEVHTVQLCGSKVVYWVESSKENNHQLIAL